MRIADRRWRFLSVVPIAIGIVLIFVDSFTKELSGAPATLLDVPFTLMGGGLLGLGIGVVIASSRAARQADNAKPRTVPPCRDE